ncbi:MAG: PEP-CTERM sorting domain-containing protein, partial [Phycisphaeraceae bacterium]
LAAQSGTIAGVSLSRPHDVVIDPDTNWLYAINPNSGDVFRFSAIGQNETKLNLSSELGGYSRSLTFANGKVYAIGSAAGKIVEIVDWESGQFNVYQSPDDGKSDGSSGSWSSTGLVINDIEFYDDHWYASSYFSGSGNNENKLIRFETFDDFEAGNWEDVSALVPDGQVPYYFTVEGDSLYLAVFTPNSADAILKITTVPEPSAALLLLGGFAAAGFCRRRRRDSRFN